MDKKYRDSLSELVQSLLPVDVSEDEPDASVTADSSRSPTRKKKRRSNKLGPGKDGMFAQEDEYVARWWTSDEHDTVTSRDGDSTKKRLAGLRLRETKLQTILILEVLALQSSPQAAIAEAGDEHGTRPENGDEARRSTKTGRRKKALDLALTLELLLDRLCIWQSVNLDGPGQTTSQSVNPEGGSRDGRGNAATKGDSTSTLR